MENPIEGRYKAMLKAGGVAADFKLESFDGSQITLKEMLASGNNVVLVFLRHLG